MHYLDNDELRNETIRCKEQHQMSERLGAMLVKLVTVYSRKENFCGYSFINDMRSHAYLRLMVNWQRYDPKRSPNAFAFYTLIIHHSFLQVIKSESRIQRHKDEAYVEAGLAPSYKYQINEEEKQHVSA